MGPLGIGKDGCGDRSWMLGGRGRGHSVLALSPDPVPWPWGQGVASFDSLQPQQRESLL